MIRQRLRSLLWRVPVEQEVREELAHHVELRTATDCRRAWTPDAARAEAVRRLGDPQRIEATLQRLGAHRNRAWARQEWLAELVTTSVSRSARPPAARLHPGGGPDAGNWPWRHHGHLQRRARGGARAVPVRAAGAGAVGLHHLAGATGSTSVGNFDYIRRRVRTFDRFAASAEEFQSTGGDHRSGAGCARQEFLRGVRHRPGPDVASHRSEDQPGRDQVVVLTHASGSADSLATRRWSAVRFA